MEGFGDAVGDVVGAAFAELALQEGFGDVVGAACVEVALRVLEPNGEMPADADDVPEDAPQCTIYYTI